MFINYLYVFLISMVPVIELRGAIPIGVGMGLDVILLYVVCIIGNCIPIPIILFLVKKVLTWMRVCNVKLFNKVANFMFEKAEKNRPKIDKYGPWGLFLFVAIPIPGTGAWTGTLVASLFDMDKKKTMISVFAGVLAAGIIMMFGSKLVEFIISLF